MKKVTTALLCQLKSKNEYVENVYIIPNRTVAYGEDITLYDKYINAIFSGIEDRYIQPLNVCIFVGICHIPTHFMMGWI